MASAVISFLGALYSTKPSTVGLDLVNQSAAVRSRDQIALGVHRQYTNVGFVTFEEDRVLALGRNPKISP